MRLICLLYPGWGQCWQACISQLFVQWPHVNSLKSRLQKLASAIDSVDYDGIRVNKRVRNAVLGCNLKNDRMISVHFQSKPLNITVIQIYVPTINVEEAEVEQFYEDLQNLPELTNKKWCPFHHRGLECKSRKSRDVWSNRQIWPWSKKWSRAKANRVLPREHTGRTKHPLPTTQRRLHMDKTG